MVKGRKEGQTIGQLIREIRLELGYDRQYKFANVLGITPAFMSNLEAGRKKPGKKLIKKLAEISGRDVCDFF